MAAWTQLGARRGLRRSRRSTPAHDGRTSCCRTSVSESESSSLEPLRTRGILHDNRRCARCDRARGAQGDGTRRPRTRRHPHSPAWRRPPRPYHCHRFHRSRWRPWLQHREAPEPAPAQPICWRASTSGPGDGGPASQATVPVGGWGAWVWLRRPLGLAMVRAWTQGAAQGRSCSAASAAPLAAPRLPPLPPTILSRPPPCPCLCPCLCPCRCPFGRHLRRRTRRGWAR
mmetsp:Transcript_4643/g.9991  ORF Transcript_4643/g.9991 Transcript_4643/m.9991 type:complete len:229 (+) Transcript_4643:391-1077(+)